ncbi:glycoside hydrolase family 2 TIM barrel-domain containing protein [uncultured Winogradskyella sp.]|uniref:glycoside hydrolase family 2 TIM barrel-domain containing protein n=1 Tax=uncultured Winogradskyella sp. TaxID=395353 RepID=UPI0027963476|nr:glycoside hydrolase family 2 TIM barrel-domain containing protein [uncultured Winogradskyella sp.]
MALVIYGIAAIFSYLNTGADRSTMLHTEIKQVDQYLPEFNWEPLNNEGRPMDQQTLKAIEDDYLDAWYVKYISYKTNTKTGIEDYYTKSARLNIFNIIDQNTTSQTTIEGTSLAHNPNLEFFSEDGQMVVITDKDVIEYKRIYKGDKFITEINEISTYKVTLLLEDGFWRIRHLVKSKSDFYYPKSSDNTFLVNNIKGINYYPKDTPWDIYGKNFDAFVISKDFEIIKNAGLNSVRLFVPYEDFGKSNVKIDKLKRLSKVLDIAESKNLKVLVTLFDFYGDYSVLDWTLNQKHVKIIINHIKNHKALMGWDIKNEPNLDFESRGKGLVQAWLDKMIDLVKFNDPNHPITIGWSNKENANLLADKLDFISFHYYEDLEKLSDSYTSLKSKIKDKPIVITEFGMSSYDGIWNPTGNSEKDQANYHKAIQDIFTANKIQFMSWTLYDFEKIPKEVVGRLPWRQNVQKHFGFIDKNGAKKASYKYISSSK